MTNAEHTPGPTEQPTRILILGAAGRDSHNFNVVFRDDPRYEVVAFTAQQIPHIAERVFPRELAGAAYPNGIPIHDEKRLEALIRELHVDACVMSYSDVAHVDVMHLASRANAAGANFELLGASRTMLRSRLPVVAVCASHRGGKEPDESCRGATSPRSRAACCRAASPNAVRRSRGRASPAVRERRRPRTAPRDDRGARGVRAARRRGLGRLRRRRLRAILERAEADADVLVWDGGNNDTSFLEADIYIAVVDPHRPGDELTYYRGRRTFDSPRPC